MMARQVGRVTAAAAATAIVAAAVWALRPAPTVVETAIAARGALTATVVAEGRTRVQNLYVVAAPVDGDLERIAPQPGDAIAPGTVVARLWPLAPRPLDARARAEAESSVAAARSAVSQAEAMAREAGSALLHAESQSATARTLATQGATARNEAEHAEHQTQIQRGAVDAVNAALVRARAELRRAEATAANDLVRGGRTATLVTAPIYGHVLRVLHESGGPVVSGTPLLEIGDVGDLEVTADLLTADAVQVKAGARAEVRNWGGPEPVRATVRRVDPAAFTKVSALGVEEQRVRTVLDVMEPRPVGPGHDFRVTVAIAVWTGDKVLRVPSTALFRRGNEWAVFVVREGRAHITSVVIGRADDTHTAVERGLADGDVVVVQPSDRLVDGGRVSEVRRGGV
jgi:HlyD family secretion protein